MNGFDFQDAGKDLTFTFVGKGSGAGMIMYLLMFILLGVLFGFAAWYAYEWYKNQPNQQNQ
jgi:hypothetical protein